MMADALKRKSSGKKVEAKPAKKAAPSKAKSKPAKKKKR
jgi:hypothetical protein